MEDVADIADAKMIFTDKTTNLLAEVNSKYCKHFLKIVQWDNSNSKLIFTNIISCPAFMLFVFEMDNIA